MRSIGLSALLILGVAGLSAPWDGAAAPTESLRLNDRGRVVAGTQERFPVGIYVALEVRWVDLDPAKVKTLLHDLAASPFDFTVNSGDTDGTPDQQARLLAEMERRGIHNVFSVRDLHHNPHFPARGPLAGQEQDHVVRQVVRAHRGSPAVVGWYTSDEPDGDPDPIHDQRRRVNSEGPTRPTLMVTHLSKPEQLATRVPTADIIGVDPYLVPERPVADLAEVVRSMEQLAGDQPVWFVLQEFGWYQYAGSIRDEPGVPPLDPVREKRRTTLRERRCLTYAALAEGVDRQVVYYHKDLVEGIDAPRKWAGVKALAGEVKSLSPILLAPPAEGVTFDPSTADVRVRAFRPSPGGPVALLVANTSPQTATCVVCLTEAVTTAALRSGDCFVYPAGREVLLILDGLESVVVELRLPGQSSARPGGAMSTSMNSARQTRHKIDCRALTIGVIVTHHLWLDLPEIATNANFDFVSVDQEHVAFDERLLSDFRAAARRVDLPVLIRPPGTRYSFVQRALNEGAVGPYDLSADLGVCRQAASPLLLDAVNTTCSAANTAGKNTMMVGDGDTLIRNGFTFVCVAEPTAFLESSL